MDKNKIISIIVVVVVVLAVAGFFMFRGDKINNPTSGNPESVATVNGVTISKTVYDAQLTSAISSYKTQGIDVTKADELAKIKTQVLNNLIDNELVSQGIVSSGIKVDDADIEKQIQDIIKQTGGADKFQVELTKANLTEAQLRDNISKQLTLQKYLEANVDVSKITVSDTEISEFYKQYSDAQKTASSTTKVPALKELSDQIKQQITSNKQQALINDFVASLRSKAQITTSTAL
ncbi:MAG: SurA N-terminal domain-containing protein [Candidatus Paceibacterota bacterium]|jgi:peptidyl-prolyl cis-trans isomerase SurA